MIRRTFFYLQFAAACVLFLPPMLVAGAAGVLTAMLVWAFKEGWGYVDR
jgi:hypothetical protein